MRTLRPGQLTRILIGGPDLEQPLLVHETDQILLEAPNWTADGSALLLNGEGALWALPADGDGPLRKIPHVDLPPINNDHVLHPDGTHILMSAGPADDGQIYCGRLDGGPVTRLTEGPGGHYLHGVSPDGQRIAYVDLEHGIGRLRIQTLTTGDITTLETGRGHLDGPEFSPDGQWLLLNTEELATAPGHAQLARIPAEGGRLERLVSSATADWFPHVSPDGAHASYLSYPPGTLGHPADLPVSVTVVATTSWEVPRQRYQLLGGQGTLNVNSWSPSSDRFAMVAYPMG